MNAVSEIKTIIKECKKDNFKKPLETIALANGELSQKDKTMLLKLMADGNKARHAELKKQLHEIIHSDVDIPDYIHEHVFLADAGAYCNIETLVALTDKSFNTCFDSIDIGDEDSDDSITLQPTKLFKMLKGLCVDTMNWQPVPYGKKTMDIATMKNGTVFLNRYRPPIMKPVVGSIKLFTDLTTYLIPNKKERELLYDWMAFTLRFPNIKINWQILFIGNPRIGKDAIITPLCRIMDGSAKEAGNAELEDTSFSDYLLDAKLLTLQEVHHPRNKKVQALIKVYTANTSGGILRINPKYGRKIETKNLLSVVAFSNFDDAIQIDEDDDRFLVINSRLSRKPDKYYGDYFKWLNKSQGAEKVMNFLLKRNIKDFNYGALPIRTVAYHSLVKEGRSQWIQSLEVLLDDGQKPFNKDYIISNDVAKFINKELVSSKFMVSDKKVSTVLKSFGFSKIKCRGARKLNGKVLTTPYLWATGKALAKLNKMSATGVFDFYVKADSAFYKIIKNDNPELILKIFKNLTTKK